MTQNIVEAAGTTNEETIAERLVESLVHHADAFGVGISDELMGGFQNFFAEVIEEEREEAPYDEDVNGLTVSVVDRLASAMQRFATDIEGGNF